MHNVENSKLLELGRNIISTLINEREDSSVLVESPVQQFRNSLLRLEWIHDSCQAMLLNLCSVSGL
jgi:hypothetical protein